MKISEDRTRLKPLNYAFTRRAPDKVNIGFLEVEEKVKDYIISMLRKKHVLEIGSGLGRWTSILKENDIDFAGCDVLPKSIEILKSKFPNNTFKLCGEKLPFKDKEFDCIFWANVANSDGIDKQMFYEEIYRVLNEGGDLIFLELKTDLTYLNRFDMVEIRRLGMGVTYLIGRFLFILPSFIGNAIISILKSIDNKIYPYFSMYHLYHFKKRTE